MKKYSVYSTTVNGRPMFYAVNGDTVKCSGNGCQSFKDSTVNAYYVKGNMCYSHQQIIN